MLVHPLPPAGLPRVAPVATLERRDWRFGGDLLCAHVDACTGSVKVYERRRTVLPDPTDRGYAVRVLGRRQKCPITNL